MVLLVYPRIITTTQTRYLEPFIFNSIPVSLGFLSGYLESRDIKAKIIDEQVTDLSPNFIEKEIRRLTTPKIVGISVLSSTYKRACQLAETIKNIDHSVTVIIGGIHPSATPEECLKEPFFDIVVRGEGEETLYEIVNNLNHGLGLAAISGISYKQKDRVVHNPDRALITDLDEIPPFPYHIFGDRLDDYKEFGIVISSRGCPYRCIFCSSRLISQYKYRYHSIKRITDNIEVLIDKYRQKRISFLDDNILSDRARFFKILDFILEKGFQKKARFYICARGKDIDEEVCQRLKEANFELDLNLEVGTNRLLKYIKKAETVEDNVKAVLTAKKYGINVTSVFIFGFPTETRADRLAAIRLSRRLPIDSVRFNIAVPYPGTELFDIAKENNRLNIKGKYENFSVQYYLEGDDLPYDLPKEEKKKVIFDVFWANLTFYLRPAVFFRNFLSGNFAGHAISIETKRPLLLFKNGAMLLFLFAKRFMVIFARNFFS